VDGARGTTNSSTLPQQHPVVGSAALRVAYVAGESRRELDT
jgi:hypothetical protein